MNYFRIENTLTVLHIGKQARIDGEAARHIRDSRRMKAGDEIEIQDATPARYKARIVELAKSAVIVEPFEEMVLPCEPSKQITLLQALIAEQNINMVLQKVTELGVSHIMLFQAERSPHMVKADRLEHKLTRWQRILESACEQSGRTNPPSLTVVNTLNDALEHMQGTLVLLEHTAPITPPIGDVTLVVGPEGGLTDTEKNAVLAIPQVTTLSIGTYTLRAETAAIAGVARLI